MSAYFSEPIRAVTILHDYMPLVLALLLAMPAAAGRGTLATAVGPAGISHAARANSWRTLHCERGTEQITATLNASR